ncbi:deoxyhypusine synthase [Babesia caballi]|uniref:deoxyhypusine synthase n=1 Tax=Babesia caballi TaxID=5871 RepID=A0AAV4LT70_BABCB|nr:deoxyhypusine synthase [Babesia caballi]
MTGTAEDSSNIPETASKAVLQPSTLPEDCSAYVDGLRYENDVHISELLRVYKNFGFQATNLGLAADMIDRMLKFRLSDEPLAEEDVGTAYEDPEVRKRTKCTIWLSFTSNMISCGLRDAFVYLAKHKLIDVVVTSGGGVEEDLIKCMGKTYVGKFNMDGATMRERGLNRIGNLFIPNDNYCAFEEWLQPRLNEMHRQQVEKGVEWTPSSFIDFLGKEINDERSFCYWCHKNKIPVFCPGITDGSIGDNLYFHTYRRSEPTTLRIDVVRDIRRVNDIAVHSRKSGIIILGGGLAKHHVCNANLMRNGADYAVYISTAQEYDGSDSGANPDEAVSWGKIKAHSDPVKVHADVSLVFPLLVAGGGHDGPADPDRELPVLDGAGELHGRVVVDGRPEVLFAPLGQPAEERAPAGKHDVAEERTVHIRLAVPDGVVDHVDHLRRVAPGHLGGEQHLGALEARVAQRNRAPVRQRVAPGVLLRVLFERLQLLLVVQRHVAAVVLDLLCDLPVLHLRRVQAGQAGQHERGDVVAPHVQPPHRVRHDRPLVDGHRVRHALAEVEHQARGLRGAVQRQQRRRGHVEPRDLERLEEQLAAALTVQLRVERRLREQNGVLPLRDLELVFKGMHPQPLRERPDTASLPPPNEVCSPVADDPMLHWAHDRLGVLLLHGVISQQELGSISLVCEAIARSHCTTYTLRAS